MSISWGIWAHTSTENCSSSSKSQGFQVSKLILSSFHRFSTAVTSGFWQSHMRTLTYGAFQSVWDEYGCIIWVIFVVGIPISKPEARMSALFFHYFLLYQHNPIFFFLFFWSSAFWSKVSCGWNRKRVWQHYFENSAFWVKRSVPSLTKQKQHPHAQNVCVLSH